MHSLSILLGFLGGLGTPEIILISSFFLFPLCLIPLIFYLITIQRALQKCSLQNQAMDPVQVWLMLIPVFNLFWQFFIVINVSKSLENEFRSRNIPIEPEPGKSLGIAYCILVLCSCIPFLGVLSAFAGLICWIMYWIKISNYSAELDRHPVG